MTCHACGAPLAATAKFCHKCGAQVGGGQAPGWWVGLPWGVAGAALGALLAVLALRIGRSREPGAVPDGARGGTAAGSLLPAPDISQMSPEERATRLYNRVMTLHSQGKADSAEFFLPMALQAYAMLPALDIDGRLPASRTIRLAHSPDADDAFMFWALAAGKIDTGTRRYEHELADIETLNRRALRGELEVTAVSLHAYAHLADRYVLLAHGAS